MSDYSYTTTEAATALDVTPGRIRQMLLAHELDSIKRGRDRFISAKSVEEARRRKTKPGPAAKTSPTKPKK